MEEDEGGRKKSKGSRNGKGDKMEQKGKSRIRPMSHWKSNLQAWRHKIGKAENSECRKCKKYAETGKHVALVCTHGEDIGRRWSTWEDMDDRAR